VTWFKFRVSGFKFQVKKWDMENGGIGKSQKKAADRSAALSIADSRKFVEKIEIIDHFDAGTHHPPSDSRVPDHVPATC
jgi:hypothetical protein